jgi:hypothetical protein
MSHEDIEGGMCPECKALTPEREAELRALDEEDQRRREWLLREAEHSIGKVLVNPEGLRQLRTINDQAWEAAVEADKKQKPKPPQPRPKTTDDGQQPLRPQEVEMTCPLCGHDRVMRYPQRTYDQVKWHHICQGCKCAFDPELD